MTILDLVKIADPKKPGDYLLINRRDFDPARHVEFGTGEAPASPVPAQVKGKRKPKGL
jgi:hypothetical protein